MEFWPKIKVFRIFCPVSGLKLNPVWVTLLVNVVVGLRHEPGKYRDTPSLFQRSSQNFPGPSKAMRRGGSRECVVCTYTANSFSLIDGFASIPTFDLSLYSNPDTLKIFICPCPELPHQISIWFSFAHLKWESSLLEIERRGMCEALQQLVRFSHFCFH